MLFKSETKTKSHLSQNFLVKLLSLIICTKNKQEERKYWEEIINRMRKFSFE